MTDQRGHLRLRVEGTGEETFHRDPAELGAPAVREPEVRALPPSADDRAAGVRRFETTVDGWIFEVAVEDEPRALLREKAGRGAGRGGHAGSDHIKAQIPGRVVRLWVAEGDTVEAGQRLLAIEAMKMENEVRAHRAGTVESIRVAPDSSVELGDELLTVR
jgi:biotin carboxyl carrier protein